MLDAPGALPPPQSSLLSAGTLGLPPLLSLLLPLMLALQLLLSTLDGKKEIFYASAPTGHFSFEISLQHIFGFTEDYEKVVFGLRHSLQLNRKASNDDGIFRADGVDAG